MGDTDKAFGPGQDMCSWVPKAAFRYLAHTEHGASIRSLARNAGCHASTVLRQVRTFEARRDDPLVDEALRRIGAWLDRKDPNNLSQREHGQSASKEDEMTVVDATPVHEIPEALSTTRFRQEARRVLKGLSEPDALLAVAVDMDKAVVLRETEAGSTRKAVVDRSIAEAMALKSWISCATPGRISRYRITGAGRVALEQLQSEVEAEDAGQTDKEAAFLGGRYR